MPNYEDYKRAKEERRMEEEYREEAWDFFEDLFGESAPEPEPKKFDPNETGSMQNFMLGLTAGLTMPSGKYVGGTQEEIGAFEEQQAVLREQAIERDIRAGMYDGTELGRMTRAQRQEQYRRNAIDRKQARWERNYEAEQKAKKRAARKQARDER
jgi:hypothetical protein